MSPASDAASLTPPLTEILATGAGMLHLVLFGVVVVLLAAGRAAISQTRLWLVAMFLLPVLGPAIVVVQSARSRRRAAITRATA